MGMIKEFFQSDGKTPVEIEELKIIERGKEIVEAVDFSIQAVILSGPGEVSSGMREMR